MILQCILVFQRFSRHYLLYSEWLACDSSHQRSHKLATGPAHTSLFSHGWLLVAPHKLPNFTVLPNTKISAHSVRMSAGVACHGPGGPKLI